MALVANVKAGDGFSIVDDVLYRVSNSLQTVVVPDVDDLRARIVYEHHDVPLGGHLGAYRVL